MSSVIFASPSRGDELKMDFRAMMYLHFHHRQGKLASDSHQILLDAFTDQAPSKQTVVRLVQEGKI